MTGRLWRTLVVLHRYLGVAVGLLMAMWFMSGIVMMYVPFPRLTEGERLQIQPPMSWAACCRFGERMADDQPVLRAQVESHLGVPALRLRRAGQPDALLDLSQGAPMPIDAETARHVARDAAPRIIGRDAAILAHEQVTADQWTVGRYVRDRPLHRFDFDDPARTSLYVSSTTGQIVVWTTATQRFWNWLGTIPHWLYFTALRSDVVLWSQVVIWTSILGTFLTVVGIGLGITQFRRGAGGRFSPYRGLFYWHHLAGLAFGLVTLTWVVSGLFSMNPWGFLESRGAGEAARIQGAPPAWSEIKSSLDALRSHPGLANAVSLTTAPLGGRLYWLVTRQDGTVARLDAAGAVSPPTAADLADAAQRLAGSQGIAAQGMMSAEDAYYFSRRETFVLPVYRVIANDDERTRFYLDPASGALLARADANGRWQRWLFGGLHRLDFTAWLRARPLWDIVVLVLMLGGVGVTVTGCWLAVRRIRADVGRLFRPRGTLTKGGATVASTAPPGYSGQG
ncbi:MAG: hypothetical protein QOG83_1187 [Alphaproteobacteria bacterium]|nr:hypothetical protein [Alphaproteobacteria bacterium]